MQDFVHQPKLELPPRMAPSIQLVSQNPRIWVTDDSVSTELLESVDEAFKSENRNVVEKHSGRKIVARNIDFEKDDLWQELFERISDICGLEGAVPRHRNFMVTEVYGSGQDAHVDHANVDDVASGDPIDFLDMTRQSPSRSDPRRVVPTISIILYFNSVGGIRFPYADGMQTIAGKRGRMIFFENYKDEARPLHATSATHYGIYFEQVPKRILVMGVLANKTPSMDRSAEPTKGLIYGAGTERDPLFHDNPSYDMYKIGGGQVVVAQKPDFIVSLEVSSSKGDATVLGRNLAGEEVFNKQCSKDTSLKFIMDQIKVKVDPGNTRNVLLCRTDGQLLTEEHMNQKLDECFKDLMETENRMTASRCFGLCGSSTSP